MAPTDIAATVPVLPASDDRVTEGESTPQAALARLQGFLDAFARINGFGDVSYTFSFERLPDGPDVGAAVERSFGGDATQVRLEEVAEWRTAIRDALASWLFRFLGEFDRRRPAGAGGEFVAKVVGQLHVGDETVRRKLVEDVVALLVKIGEPRRVWKVDVTTEHWYEASWQDFAFETQDARYLLHLGVSD